MFPAKAYGLRKVFGLQLIPDARRTEGTKHMRNDQSKKKPILKFLLIGGGTITVLVVAMIIGVGVWLYSRAEDIEMTAYHPFRSATAKKQGNHSFDIDIFCNERIICQGIIFLAALQYGRYRGVHLSVRFTFLNIIRPASRWASVN